MTATTKPDIKPNIYEGEPWCSFEDCPNYDYSTGIHLCEEICGPVPNDFQAHPFCIPGLRRQRDERTAERDSARRELCDVRGESLSGMHLNPSAAYSYKRGWSYLYEVKP